MLAAKVRVVMQVKNGSCGQDVSGGIMMVLWRTKLPSSPVMELAPK